MWSDDDQRWSEARIIFVDTEPSNWTWDPQREQYYWHRFFHHQPDLNYDNPEVPDAMLDVVRFWLDLGLDGFRLDAVPYLFERDGTNGENLPETHEYLKRMRQDGRREFPGRVLLAEANQWPADVVDYFGDGDECHMCFHFPLMPRMFMAVRREQRYPITEILAQTPDIPDGCQWGIFLRNHDELTLEMVTDEERDYMYSGVREGPADEAQHRHLAAGCSRCSTTTDGSPSCSTRCCSRCRAARSSTTATRSAWATTSTSATATACARRCSGRPTATPASAGADFAQLYLPPLDGSGLRLPGRQRRRRDAQPVARSCTGCSACSRCAREHPVFGIGTFEVLSAENPSVLAYLRRSVIEDGRRHRAVRQQPQPVRPAGRAHAGRLRRQGAASSCSGACRSPASASCRTSSRSPPTASTGSRCMIEG